MASSGSFNTSSSNNRCLTFSWSISSQSIANNTTTISWKLVGAGSASGYIKCGGFYVVINGSVVCDKSTDYRIQVYNGTVCASGTHTISHNANGTKSFSASAQAGIYSYARNCSGSGSWTLTTIPRQANISAAPNFNDEENPSITYSNPAGNNVTSLDACISLTGAKDDVPYRAISKTGTSYTFELTEAERNTLRNACIDANSRTVMFYIRTVIGGNTFYSNVSKTLSIVNANPTFTASAEDTLPETIALTGDSSRIIKGFNDIAVSMSATAYKGATIKEYSIKNGGVTICGASGMMLNVESGSFIFSVTDSRGNTASETITKTLVDYIKLTSNLDVKAPNADGEMTFHIRGNYFNDTFGTENNTLTVEYRYKENDGSYSEWQIVTAAINENSYDAEISLTGLNYRNSYTFQARAKDKLFIDGVSTEEKRVKTTPVFDWSGDDFNFNVPITIQGNPLIDLIYPVGSIYMSTNDANPSLLLGGTWEEWGSGKVPVGVKADDTDFATVEKTGGSKTNTHNHYTLFSNDGSYFYMETSSNAPRTRVVTKNRGSWTLSNSSGATREDSTYNETISVLQPYITCYMWKRTA